jgi:hypothetical protein
MSDADVRIAILHHFLDQGSAPTHQDIAATLGITPVEAEAAFARLHQAHTIVLAPGSPYIWMANPFSAIPTTYKVRAGATEWWGNCIWDSLGIIAMAGRDGRVEGSCPDCGEPLVVEVRDGEIRHHDEVVHYSVPAAHWWDDIGAT